jgi:hypothetical protein
MNTARQPTDDWETVSSFAVRSAAFEQRMKSRYLFHCFHRVDVTTQGSTHLHGQAPQMGVAGSGRLAVGRYGFVEVTYDDRP